MLEVHFNPRNLFSALGAVIGLYLLSVLGIWYFGVSEVDSLSYVVSLPTIFGVLFLVLFGFVSTGEISWSKQGWDFSVLAFGAMISTVTLQFFMKTPALPRLTTSLIGKKLSGVVGSSNVMLVILSCGILFSIFTCFVTSFVEIFLKAGTKSDPNYKYKNSLAWFNYILGVVALSWYIAMVFGGIETT